jgi:hypothetical protein
MGESMAGSETLSLYEAIRLCRSVTPTGALAAELLLRVLSRPHTVAAFAQFPAGQINSATFMGWMVTAGDLRSTRFEIRQRFPSIIGDAGSLYLRNAGFVDVEKNEITFRSTPVGRGAAEIREHTWRGVTIARDSLRCELGLDPKVEILEPEHPVMVVTPATLPLPVVVTNTSRNPVPVGQAQPPAGIDADVPRSRQRWVFDAFDRLPRKHNERPGAHFDRIVREMPKAVLERWNGPDRPKQAKAFVARRYTDGHRFEASKGKK